MKPKQTLILLVIVAAVVAAIAIHQLVVVPGQSEKQQEQELLFPGFEPKEVRKIEISQGDTLEVLVRGGDSVWSVETKNNYRADIDAVSSLLTGLKDLKQGNPASESKTNHARLGVDDSGLTVKMSDKTGIIAQIIVGNQGTNYGTTFVRKPDSDTTYLVYENLKGTFERQWRDKQVFRAEPEDVKEVRLYQKPEPEEGEEPAASSDYEIMVLRREESGQWGMVTSGDSVEKLDKQKADAVARNLVKLRASDFADDTDLETAGLVDPSKKAVFVLNDGKEQTLLVGDKDDSGYYVKAADSDVVLKVYQYNIRNIYKDRQTLAPTAGEPEGDFDPSQFLPAPQLDAPGGFEAE